MRGTRDLQVDLRVVTGTNRDLRKAIEQGRFRVDLYYRLNVIQMTVPPLRDRKDDIMPLAQYFVALNNRKFRRQVQGLQEDAWSRLHAHNRPGNIRELRNAIDRSSGDLSLAEVERTMLIKALSKASWNQTRASRLLKFSRDTLRYKMKKCDLNALARPLVLWHGQPGQLWIPSSYKAPRPSRLEMTVKCRSQANGSSRSSVRTSPAPISSRAARYIHPSFPPQIQ